MNIIASEEALRWLAIEMINANLHGLCFFECGQQIFHIEREHRAALEWFNRRDANFPGYGWALGMTGLNPNLIRRKIEEQCWKFERQKALYSASRVNRRPKRKIFRIKYYIDQTLKLLGKYQTLRSAEVAQFLHLNPVTAQKIGRILAENNLIIIRRNGSRPAVWERI